MYSLVSQMLLYFWPAMFSIVVLTESWVLLSANSFKRRGSNRILFLLWKTIMSYMTCIQSFCWHAQIRLASFLQYVFLQCNRWTFIWRLVDVTWVERDNTSSLIRVGGSSVTSLLVVDASKYGVWSWKIKSSNSCMHVKWKMHNW